MKKLIATILLIFSLILPINSYAIDPFSITAFAGYSLLAHVGLAGVAYYLNPTKPTITPSGAIAANATVAWVELSNNVPTLKTKDVVAAVSYSDFKNRVLGVGSSSPLYDAFFTKSPLDYTDSSKLSLSTPIGSVVYNKYNSQNAVTTGTPFLTRTSYVANALCGSNPFADSATRINWITCDYYTDSTQIERRYAVYVSSTITPPDISPVPKTPSQVASSLTAPSAVQYSSINDVITDPNIMKYYYAGANLSIWSDGSYVLSSSDPNIFTEPTAVASDTVQTAANNTNTAFSAYNAAALNYKNNPNDTTLSALTAARNNYNSAATTQNSVMSGSGITPVQTISNDVNSPVQSPLNTSEGSPTFNNISSASGVSLTGNSVVTSTIKGSYNTVYERLNEILHTKYPFTLMSVGVDWLTALVDTPDAPVIHIAIGSHEYNKDMSSFNPLATFMRWMLGSYFCIVIGVFLQKKYMGIER